MHDGDLDALGREGAVTNASTAIGAQPDDGALVGLLDGDGGP